MPKKKQQKAKSAKLPKEIAGVKISRELRSVVEPVLRFASHPLVSDALASAILVGAGKLTGNKAGGKAKGKEDGGEAGSAKATDPIGLMVAMAAGEIASRIVDAYRDKSDDRRSDDSDRRKSADRRKKIGESPSGKERRVVAGDRRTAKDRRA
jgi:hypothetical protein